MPKKGQERSLPRDLREVLRVNLDDLMAKRGWSAREVGTQSGVGASSVKRYLLPIDHEDSSAANLDTIQALAAAFDVQPWILLMKGGTASIGKVFSTPVEDVRLGKNWTRPDRKPLLQSDRQRPSTQKPKIKIR